MTGTLVNCAYDPSWSLRLNAAVNALIMTDGLAGTQLLHRWLLDVCTLPDNRAASLWEVPVLRVLPTTSVLPDLGIIKESLGRYSPGDTASWQETAWVQTIVHGFD
jgi:hypothetical protein